MAVGAVHCVPPQVELLAGDPLRVHDPKAVEEPVEAVDRGGHPLHPGGLVEEELVVDGLLHLEEGMLDGGDARQASERAGGRE